MKDNFQMGFHRFFLSTGKALLCFLLVGISMIPASGKNTENHPSSLCTADFTYSISGDTVYFKDSSQYDTAGISFFWEFGDGDSSHDQNPVHVYQNNKVYNVCLTITGPNCSSKKYQFINISVPVYDVHLKLIKEFAWESYDVHGNMYLITYDSLLGRQRIIDTIAIDQSDTCTFHGLKQGNYYFKAALSGSDTDFFEYLPTYQFDKINWKAAAGFTIPHLNKHDTLQIMLVKTVNPGGSGFATGKVYKGDSDTVMKNVLLIITKWDNTPVNFAYTDEDGAYSFNNLTFGSYRFWVEEVGINSETYEITVDQNGPSAMNKDFSFHSALISKRETHAGIWRPDFSVLLYPNPVSNELYIDAGSLDLELCLYDLQGKPLYTGPVQGKAVVSTTMLSNGLYIATFTTREGAVSRYKLIKTN